MISLIAMLTMLIDHTGAILFPNIPFLRIVGRLSFPLFAYGISKGYKHTRNLKMYMIRLILLASISQIPFIFAFNNGYLNICFTLFTGLLTIKTYDSNLPKFLRYILIFLMLVLSQILHFEYGFYGILTILIFYLLGDTEKVVFFQFFLTVISTIALRYEPIELFSAFSSIIILFSNILFRNKDIKINKIFRYSFYPIHLLLLILIKKGGFF